jgi:hypothetical protein
MTRQSKNDVFLGSQPHPAKPKGLIDALSEIQQYYVVERSGSLIPEDFFTIGGKLAFFEVGFKGAFLSGLVSALLIPFAIGVFERYIPIFGSYEPSLFDQFFALILSISFSIGYAIFIASVGKYYIGVITKSAIKNLFVGFTTGIFLKLVIVFILFHSIYFFVLEPYSLAKTLMKLRFFLKYETLNRVYVFLREFRPVFLISAYFVILTSLLMVSIPLGSIIINSKRTKAMMEQEEKWKGGGNWRDERRV